MRKIMRRELKAGEIAEAEIEARISFPFMHDRYTARAKTRKRHNSRVDYNEVRLAMH